MNRKIITLLLVIVSLNVNNNIKSYIPEKFKLLKSGYDNAEEAIEPQNKIVYQDTKITLTTKDGLFRKAILSIVNNAKGNVVLCHPAAKHKEYMQSYREQLFPQYNTIAFDFRRHGEDQKKQYSTIGRDERYEVEAAAKIFKQDSRTKNLPTYGFGISLGAVAIIELESRQHTFDGIIIQSAYESLKKQIMRLYQFYRLPHMHHFIFRQPCRGFAYYCYRIKLRKIFPSTSISKITTPIFLIHALNDTFISINAYVELKKNAKSVVKTWNPEFGNHTKILKTYPELYAQHCNDFLDSLQNKSYITKSK